MKKTVSGTVVASITWLVLVLLAIYFAYNRLPATYSFGFEYGNIAASLVEGKGYGHVFVGSEGYSAWTLPINTFIYASIFAVFGVKSTAAMWACIVISCTLWSLCAYFLYQTARQFSIKLAFIAVLAQLILLVLHRTIIVSLFDYALINCLTLATVYCLYCYLRNNTHYRALAVLAPVLPLTSPGLFLAFALILAGRFVYLLMKRTGSGSGKTALMSNDYRQIVFLGLVSVLAMSVWGIRNYQALGKFIPSKSNFWYEFYQANMADDDGVLSSWTARAFHPNAGGKYRPLYDSLGEIAFVQHMKQRSKEEFYLPDYRQRVGRRAKFALVHSQNTNAKYPADTASFAPADKRILYRAGLVQEGQWIVLNIDSIALANTVASLPLQQKNAIVSDWAAKKAVYTRKMTSPGGLVREFSVSLLPSLCILLGIFITRIRTSRIFQLAVTIYFVQLLPYVLVSHYIRYQYYLLGLQALLMFLVAAYGITKLVQLGRSDPPAAFADQQ